MKQFFRECNEEKWAQLRTHPYYKEAIDRITQVTEEHLKTDPLRVKFSDLHLFQTTGDRTVFGRTYDSYQSRLENFFFMYMLTSEEKYLNALVDIIWNICDFESWSIPAHVSENLSAVRRRRNLDLCSTIMGYRLAEIVYFIGDKLPGVVRRRVEYEVRYRIIDSYKECKDYFWMHIENNWSAVCTGAIMGCYCYLGSHEETEEQLPYMMESIEAFLRGFDEDGCCKEGYGYWNYGFSYFCVFASFLKEYTDGKVNLFENPKVHQIALFQQNISINDHQAISFSDSGFGFSPQSWLSHFLKKQFPDMEFPPLKAHGGNTMPLRYILWSDPDLANTEMHPKSHIFEGSQWFIHRGNAVNFACKAGHNAESHNHNDVGSFIISKNNDVTLIDPSGGLYSKQYFSSERYNSLYTSSRGHSVPIINGAYQVTTRPAPSTIYTCTDCIYSFEMSQVYPVKELSSLKRTFEMKGDTIELTDAYTFTSTPNSVVERFVSLIEPKLVEPGLVVCGTTNIHFDPKMMEASLTFETGDGQHGNGTVHQINLEVINPKENFEIKVVFD